MDTNEKTNEQKVWITVSRTINTGDYNSVKVDAGYTKSYEKELPSKLVEDGVAELLRVIDKQTKKIRRKAKMVAKAKKFSVR